MKNVALEFVHISVVWKYLDHAMMNGYKVSPKGGKRHGWRCGDVMWTLWLKIAHRSHRRGHRSDCLVSILVRGEATEVGQ